MTDIGETVTVGAVFDPEHIVVPKWFVWNGRKHVIERVTFTWKVQDGRTAFHHFAVTDGTNLYELTYNAATLQWKLMTVNPM
jgi:hypothetical protein